MANTRRLLVVVIVLQLIIVAGQWLGAPSVVAPANAQGAKDPAADRAALLDGLKSIDAKLDKLNDFLASGNLQVKVIQPDEAKGRAPGR
jgi:hypothetical protein